MIMNALSFKEQAKNYRSSKITYRAVKRIHKKIYFNRHITCEKIKSDLNLNCHFNTVYRVIKMLGWKKINTKFCQAVSPKNEIERYLYSRLCKASNEDFSNFIFEDETTVELRWNSRKKWHLKFYDENAKGHVPRYSHNYKLHKN